MTREEAKEILEEVKVLDDSMYQYNPAYLEALDMAIAALKAEPCEDAVSRQVLAEAFRNLPHEYKTKEQRARTGGIAACQVIVEELPPVIPKQRIGKWIVKIVGKPESGGTLGKYICDNCQKATWASAIEGEPNFCPNCGADMREGDEG